MATLRKKTDKPTGKRKHSDEMQSDFLSLAAHQLRIPLTSMQWYLEMLLDGDAGPLNSEQRKFVEQVYQEMIQTLKMVKLLLQITRVESGRIKVEPVPVDLRTSTQEVLLTLKPLLDKKSQKVNIRAEPSPPPTIIIDQEAIRQVIQNLLSNAIQYSPQKSSIVVSIIQKDDWVEYSVRDQGIGIPKEQQQHVFEKFFRAKNAAKASPTGSGLGLSLAKLLVESWGGQIWFESNEGGKGTTFHFTIPLQGMEAKDGEVTLTA